MAIENKAAITAADSTWTNNKGPHIGVKAFYVGTAPFKSAHAVPPSPSKYVDQLPQQKYHHHFRVKFVCVAIHNNDNNRAKEYYISSIYRHK